MVNLPFYDIFSHSESFVCTFFFFQINLLTGGIAGAAWQRRADPTPTPSSLIFPCKFFLKINFWRQTVNATIILLLAFCCLYFVDRIMLWKVLIQWFWVNVTIFHFGTLTHSKQNFFNHFHTFPPVQFKKKNIFLKNTFEKILMLHVQATLTTDNWLSIFLLSNSFNMAKCNFNIQNR